MVDTSQSHVLRYAAASKFVQENKCQFDLIRIISGYIQGRNELYISAEQMEDFAALGSNEGTMYTALGKAVGFPKLTHQVFLDDVAKAHIVALQPERAHHLENFILVGNGGQCVAWTDVVPLIKRLYPDEVASGILDPQAKDPSRVVSYDVSSAERALGFQFSGIEKMVSSVIDQYLELRRIAHR